MGKYFYEAVMYPFEDKVEVNFPDLGVFTFGDDLTDAAFMAQDALELAISSRLEKGDEVARVGSFGHDCPEGGTLMGIAVYAEAGSANIDTMTVQEAADVLDVTRSRIYSMIRDGMLRAKKVGNQRLVNAADVMERFNNPRGAGRPHNSERNLLRA